MIEHLCVFTKGGVVLWNVEPPSEQLSAGINAILKKVVLHERMDKAVHEYGDFAFHLCLDNKFELIYLLAYHSVSPVSYADEFLAEFAGIFAQQYDLVLRDRGALLQRCDSDYFVDVLTTFSQLNRKFCRIHDSKLPVKTMRTFEQSSKAKRNATLLVDAAQKKNKKQNNTANNTGKKVNSVPVPASAIPTKLDANTTVENNSAMVVESKLAKMRENFLKRTQAKEKKPNSNAGGKLAADSNLKRKKVKENRRWDQLSGNPKLCDMSALDFSSSQTNAGDPTQRAVAVDPLLNPASIEEQRRYVGQMRGELGGLSDDDHFDEEEDADEDQDQSVTSAKQQQLDNKKRGGGLLAAFQSLVGNKTLTDDLLLGPLEKMKEQLIGKNVAAEVADKLCQSVRTSLRGSVVGQFSLIAGVVRDAFRQCLVQLLLKPERNSSLLRDILQARQSARCYSIVFCGVNGVGKSTNLAKVAFWLNENGFRVLIAACDTFRAGAVEQLRTHVRYLDELHPGLVQLYEQGYGKDAAAVAASAISYAEANNLDVVLVDTAGRMQDNEPLMRALGKLIRVNEPDLVLFVGEALVGNEAVDQLQKFSRALIDCAATDQQDTPIDGIMLTKFDTIDDKVGAAVSMTYITGKPILFVGTGQTYKDLKQLDANVVVNALLR
ncbi:Signal recognition particle receptor subunit alpha -like protein [Trichinella pseudospiralis]|uniref:Signal recognition particle receptor subunit alpha-like protein n=2 Tax=Trichinella pseudospiralis TaxID=6337 RepID=A0A0V1G0D1_TRIPS|nr:Signal recognition particle receptor subunit alpha -like protein [Trichinella pseudospiralis]KRY78248.1 Signal recognition particle receptor subunit alpha -like protein [Trichinella pseudospiralis]KRY91617.1 Signal recognition particle receptor subunit alpha -like protein [Trichinella pseudospiralis]KRZ34148.1 Signal recognition particle receptor subunit alpha -like protein [Trichinella pseudospiralis]KRZ44958.1 Signal recognition particle receptor subunit alpha -like protein [Trichinella ps